MTDQIQAAIDLIKESIQRGGKILACGNGGSASQAAHLVAELTGRFKSNRDPIPAYDLGGCVSLLTCIANDFGFDKVFSRQIRGLGFAGDVLCAFSTSWKSPNIIEAVKVANKRKMLVVAFGNGGWHLRKMQDNLRAFPFAGFINVWVTTNAGSTAGIQEDHLRFIHAICEGLE